MCSIYKTTNASVRLLREGQVHVNIESIPCKRTRYTAKKEWEHHIKQSYNLVKAKPRKKILKE